MTFSAIGSISPAPAESKPAPPATAPGIAAAPAASAAAPTDKVSISPAAHHLGGADADGDHDGR